MRNTRTGGIPPPPRTCRDVVDLLTGYMEGDLGQDTAAAVEEHLRDCPACTEYLASLRTASRAVAGLGGTPIPDEVRERLRRLLRERAAAGTA